MANCSFAMKEQKRIVKQKRIAKQKNLQNILKDTDNTEEEREKQDNYNSK